MENLHKWEILDQFTSRMRVPGGWIYQVFARSRTTLATADGLAVGLCFVPDNERDDTGPR